MKHQFAIYWVTKDREAICRIREKFKIPTYTTVNGESPAEIDDEDLPLLRETERIGFIHIRTKKWRRNGDQYIFIYR